MTQGERVKEVRKSLNLTMEQFGNKLGVTKVAISNIEKEKRNLTEQMSRAICREFNVSEEWLKTGEGEMYQQLSEDEEIAGIVSDLLEEGKDNAFYGIILEIAKTYNELSPHRKRYSRKQPRSWLTIWQKRKGTNVPLFCQSAS